MIQSVTSGSGVAAQPALQDPVLESALQDPVLESALQDPVLESALQDPVLESVEWLLAEGSCLTQSA